MSNFAEIAGAFVANAAGAQVRSERDLADTMVALMTDPIRRARLGAAARALVEANRGAKDKSMAVLTALLPPDNSMTYPSNVRPFRPIA
jgi:3-deoxy-D-manno-octulosonic-acid transferase